jgi:hypothetical protein
METKEPNLKQRTLCPPLESVIMKTTRVHSAADVVTDNHVITDLKHCFLYWTLGGSWVCLQQNCGKIWTGDQFVFIALELLRVVQEPKSRPGCCFSEWLRCRTGGRGVLARLP